MFTHPYGLCVQEEMLLYKPGTEFLYNRYLFAVP